MFVLPLVVVVVVVDVVAEVTWQFVDDRSMAQRPLLPAFLVESLKAQDLRQL